MALNFIGKKWDGATPQYSKPKKKGTGLSDIFVGFDHASKDGDKMAVAKFAKSKEGPLIPVEHAIASHVVGHPIPYDPKAPLEINWDALSPDVAKMVKDKQSEIEEKMVADFEAVTLNTKEMVAETHIPYAALEDNALASVDYADIENKIMAQVASIYGMPKEQTEEPDKADLVYKAFDLLKQVGVYIKSGDVHYEAKEITSGTLELDLHTFGAASAFTLALDMLTHKVKPE